MESFIKKLDFNNKNFYNFYVGNNYHDQIFDIIQEQSKDKDYKKCLYSSIETSIDKLEKAMLNFKDNYEAQSNLQPGFKLLFQRMFSAIHHLDKITKDDINICINFLHKLSTHNPTNLAQIDSMYDIVTFIKSKDFSKNFDQKMYEKMLDAFRIKINFGSNFEALYISYTNNSDDMNESVQNVIRDNIQACFIIRSMVENFLSNLKQDEFVRYLAINQNYYE